MDDSRTIHLVGHKLCGLYLKIHVLPLIAVWRKSGDEAK